MWQTHWIHWLFLCVFFFVSFSFFLLLFFGLAGAMACDRNVIGAMFGCGRFYRMQWNVGKIYWWKCMYIEPLYFMLCCSFFPVSRYISILPSAIADIFGRLYQQMSYQICINIKGYKIHWVVEGIKNKYFILWFKWNVRRYDLSAAIYVYCMIKSVWTVWLWYRSGSETH